MTAVIKLTGWSVFLPVCSVLCPFPVWAQCAETDCRILGYEAEQQCSGGLKCPFGDYWACPEEKTCDASFKYNCTGEYENPSGEACEGKYQTCVCDAGYKWNSYLGVCMEDCDSSYKYLCTGPFQIPVPDVCDYKYKKCDCQSGYYWDDGNGKCVKGEISEGCDGRCAGSVRPSSCPSGYHVRTSSDECGNACYQCCVTYVHERRMHENCSCRNLNEGTSYPADYVLRCDLVYYYFDPDGRQTGTSSSYDDLGHYGSLSSCQSALSSTSQGTFFYEDETMNCL